MTRNFEHSYRRSAVIAAALTATFFTSGTRAQQAAVATASRAQAHVELLASPTLEGRATGSPGADAAATYLASQLKELGARPLSGRDDFRVPFDYTADVRDAGTTLTLEASGATPQRWEGSSSVLALSFSSEGDVSGDVVFAGYGLVTPPGETFGYDSYVGLTVKDKIVVVLRYFPEDASPEMRNGLARYSGLRYKAMAARERGAKGLIVMTGPRSPNAGLVVPMAFDTAAAGSGLPAASISGEVANRLFGAGAPGRQLEEVQRELDTGNPHASGFELKGVTVSLATRVKRESKTTFNVVGVLPATSSSSNGGVAKPYVMLGAHYDHLGSQGQGNSLARAEEQGQAHLGADDNASGVAAVLEAGRELASRPRKRALILAFWSGEEIGLLGSAAFVAKPPIPLTDVAAYLNFDMVGRLRDDKLTVQATGTSPLWPRLIEQANVPAGFDIQLQEDPYLPTDSASFNQADVPTLNFFTGSHEDYHRPSDVASKINVEGLERVTSFGAAIALRIANADEAPSFSKVERTQQTGGSRDTVRAFTGTIPDYSTDVKGLLLGGVVGGGPAEQAGLQKGDIIIQFAGREITNIYDYTYALDLVKVDQPIEIVYTRNGERRQTTLTPRARR